MSSRPVATGTDGCTSMTRAARLMLPTGAMSRRKLKGRFNRPIWVAHDKGYFASGGIEVSLTNTPNSVFQLTNLIEGRNGQGARRATGEAGDRTIGYADRAGQAGFGPVPSWPLSAKPDSIRRQSDGRARVIGRCNHL